MIPIKSEKDIIAIRKSCDIIARLLKHIKQFVVEGISTAELDNKIEAFILQNGATPNFKNYNGFPNASCISVNDVVVHGIPSTKQILKNGDLVSIDAGALLNGYHSDAARTFIVGTTTPEKARLVKITEECFFEGVKHARAGKRLGDISHAIQAHAEINGFSVVRVMTGHGIGKKLHEEPVIPNFGAFGTGPVLKSGYVLAIEPMINEGTFKVKIDADGWTCRTLDAKASAHYENTVLITGSEPEILTL